MSSLDWYTYITEPNTIKLFIPYNYFNTGCKYYKKEKQTNKPENQLVKNVLLTKHQVKIAVHLKCSKYMYVVKYFSDYRIFKLEET